MNHPSLRFPPGEPDSRPRGRRALAKQETRDKVLLAAKALFIARGYEAATIRDIAAEAGMSTGAVFANFTDKTDLFHEVLRMDSAVQMSLMNAVAVGHPGPVAAALAALFAIGYELHLAQLPLLQAATSLSWTEGLEGDFGERPAGRAVIDMVIEILERGVERGQLRAGAGADTRLLAEMLWDAYVSNYRRALFDSWDLARLNARFAEQTAVILAGARTSY